MQSGKTIKLHRAVKQTTTNQLTTSYHNIRAEEHKNK